MGKLIFLLKCFRVWLKIDRNSPLPHSPQINLFSFLSNRENSPLFPKLNIILCGPLYEKVFIYMHCPLLVSVVKTIENYVGFGTLVKNTILFMVL